MTYPRTGQLSFIIATTCVVGLAFALNNRPAPGSNHSTVTSDPRGSTMPENQPENLATTQPVGIEKPIRVAAITTVGCLLLGYIVAYAISNFVTRLTPLMLALVLLPFWVSVLIRSFSWIILLGRSGLVNDTLRDIGLITSPLRLMHNELGVLIAMIHVMLPFAVLPMLANMRGISRSYTDAARGLGASEWTAFRAVYFPQTLPGVFSGALLVFVLSLGFFVTPALLGGGRVLMISEYITLSLIHI